MNILVTGSRDWQWPGLIESALKQVVTGRAADVTVHHGGARGADQIAGAVARRLGLLVVEHPADWSTHGKRAGFLRNREMVELRPDVVLAFQVNRSKGTQHTIDLATEAGIPVMGYRLNWFEE